LNQYKDLTNRLGDDAYAMEDLVALSGTRTTGEVGLEEGKVASSNSPGLEIRRSGRLRRQLCSNFVVMETEKRVP
jgi:hypothetical protein